MLILVRHIGYVIDIVEVKLIPIPHWCVLFEPILITIPFINSKFVIRKFTIYDYDRNQGNFVKI